MSTTDGMDKSIRVFSGDGAQGNSLELKKWIKWARSSMACREHEDAQRGPYLYTLLAGTALEVVDHLEFEEYSVKGG